MSMSENKGNFACHWGGIIKSTSLSMYRKVCGVS